MQNLHKKALFLSYFTVGYNILEGVCSIFFGTVTGSVALVGFGIDSFIESLSGSIMIWRFGKHGNLSKEDEERIEKKAIKLIGYSFFILGAYVLLKSGKALYFGERPDPSLAGIIIAILSLIIMPVLFYIKHKTGKALKSKSLVADSKQTLACIIMSVALLTGLALNYLYQIWWLDPIVGVFIALILFKEGKEALEEEKLCNC